MMQVSNLSIGRVLRRAGLREDLFDQSGDPSIRLSDYFRICEQMALQGDDESCHISLRPLMVGTSELVQSRLRSCATIAEVMEVLAGSYNIIHGQRYNQVRRRAGVTTYVIDDTDFPYAMGHGEPFVILSLECLLVYVHTLLLSLNFGRVSTSLRSITTRGEAESEGNSHLHFWGVSIRHSARIFALDYGSSLENLVVDPSASPVLAARTIYGGVADMLDCLEPLPKTRAEIVERVAHEIVAGRHDQNEIAHLLGMSVASLRRRLSEAGVHFRDIRANVMNDIARAAIEDGKAISEVAESLGFSDSRSFSRAFTQWNGMPPGDYRRSHK
jgi:AraC-like DNA-binding protein